MIRAFIIFIQQPKQMKYSNRIILLIAFALSIFVSHAQKLTLVEGDYSLLKSEKTVNIIFTYDHMQVGKYREEDFVKKKVNEMNQKEPGKGDAWAQNWVGLRQDSYEPMFKQVFEKYSEKKFDSTSKYTLIFHTTFTEPGFNTGAILVHKNPEINGEVILVESKDTTKPVLKFTIEKAVGREGYEFDTGRHLEGAYGVAAKEIALFLK